MITLVSISGLGILCLILEILNLRKILVPVTIVGLLTILGSTLTELCTGESLLKIESYGMISQSGFSLAFSCLFILLGIMIIIMSPQFYKEKIEKIADYISLHIFLLAGAVAMVSFQNLSVFFIGIEVLSICGYVLASSLPQNLKSNEAGMKYFIMGAFASSFILFGIALIYGTTGSFDVTTIHAMVDQNTIGWFYIGSIMILVGLLFKASIAPFHFWAPDVYEGSPTIVTTTMSTLVKVAAIATLFKVSQMLSLSPSLIKVIAILAVLSMFIGNISALKQKNLKRIMAYSGISHAGFMIMDILSGNNGNVTLYYAAAYSFAAIAGFSIIMAVCQNKDNEDISNIYGLAYRSPLKAFLMTCAMLSLGGIPVFAGFFAKMFLFEEMFQTRHILLVILGVINSIIAIYYYFKTVSVMFTEKGENNNVSSAGNNVYVYVAIISIILNLAIGIFPSLIMDLKL